MKKKRGLRRHLTLNRTLGPPGRERERGRLLRHCNCGQQLATVGRKGTRGREKEPADSFGTNKVPDSQFFADGKRGRSENLQARRSSEVLIIVSQKGRDF